jgi:hypothetical protein
LPHSNGRMESLTYCQRTSKRGSACHIAMEGWSHSQPVRGQAREGQLATQQWKDGVTHGLSEDKQERISLPHSNGRMESLSHSRPVRGQAREGQLATSQQKDGVTHILSEDKQERVSLPHHKGRMESLTDCQRTSKSGSACHIATEGWSHSQTVRGQARGLACHITMEGWSHSHPVRG